MPASKEIIDEAIASVKRMQDFDVSTLPRTDKLGTEMDFADVVEPAEKLVSLYLKINILSLAVMPQPMVEGIRDAANHDYSHFEGILNFTTAQGQGKPQRDALVKNVVNAYDNAFTNLVQHICFGFSEATDFKALENNARAALQGIKDMSAKHEKQMEESQGEARKILTEIRDVAAEQGVTQKAIYFQQEADSHKKEQKNWLKAIVGCAICAFAWLVLWDISDKEWGVALVSAVTTKALVLSLLVYGVFFCAKNYTAHRHNYVVNTHRQNALLTYRNLVDAANDEEGQDIVLMQAARCIFEQRDTGYAKGGNEGGNVVNLSPIETIRKAAKSDDED